jgi:peptidoglycan/LPS O-acetylase OafA/YrhL
MKVDSQPASQLADGRRKLEALTALRFVAASCIVLHHLRGSFGIATDAYASLNLGAAVSFFFVLSGFVLAYAYPKMRTSAEVFAFVIRRWFRVWPLHFACLLILVMLMPQLLVDAARSIQGWLELLTNSFLLQAWVPLSSFYFSFNTVSWSISVEWFFYLSFPFLLHLMLRWNSVWLSLLVSFLPLAVVLLLSAIFKVSDYSGAENQLTTHGLIYIGPLARLFEFAVGIALQFSRKNRRSFSGFERHMWLLQLLSLAMAAWFVAKGGTLGIRPWMPHVFTIWFDYSGGLPIWAFVIWTFSFSNAWPAAFLSNRLLVALGEVSFAIYLVHFSIGHAAARQFCQLFHIENSSLQLALYLLLVIGASFCLYYAIERPGMAIGRHWANCVYPKRDLSKTERQEASVQELVSNSSRTPAD